MVLETERDYYESRKPEFLAAYAEQFVLIKGREFVGAYSTAAQAYEAGLQRFGNQPFLIQHVLPEEPRAQLLTLQLGLLNARA